MNLLLHSQTKKSVDSFLANPSHGLLIIGEAGAGKGSLARHLLDSLVGTAHNQYIKIIGQDSTTITIETIREVIQFTKLTVPGKGQFRRAIVIEHAHYLTNEAQNALLKLLEEPPANTLMVLTADSLSGLLPTISSRLQSLIVLPVSLPQSLEYFDESGYDISEITPNYHISGGNVGLLSSLLSQAEEHPLVQQISLAKQILRSTKFDKVAAVDQIISQKQDVGSVLLALMRVSRAALQQAVTTQNTKNIERWKQTLHSIISAQDTIVYKPNNKLLLTQLMLNL